MRKFNSKMAFSVLICALCLSFQVKAQTPISQVGSVSITSITSADGSVTYSASNPAPVPGVNVVFNFAISITNLCALTAGETITIPLGVQSGSYFAMPGMSFPTDDIYNGTADVFSVSYNNNAITLTVNSGASSGCSADPNSPSTKAFAFTLSANAQIQMNSVNNAATTSTFTAGGSSYAVANQAFSFTTINSNGINVGSPASQQNSATYWTSMTLYGIYNQYLMPASTATINPTDAMWTTNVVIVDSIPANSNIVNVVFNTSGGLGMTLVTGSGSSESVTGTTTSYVTGGNNATNFNTAAYGSNATISQIEANLPVGSRTIVQEADGSYIVAINLGTLLGSSVTQYSSNSTVADQPTNAVLQNAIAAKMAAVLFNTQIQVNFTDPQAKQTAQVYVTNTLPSVFTGNNPITLSDNYTPTIQAGQTQIVENYVTPSGTNVQPMVYHPGWPSDNALGETPTAPQIITPPTSIVVNNVTYNLTTDPSVLATVTSSIPASAIFTNALAQGDTAVAFPLSGQPNANVYFIYVAVSNGLPITGLQLTAQPQANNDVLLTWGTLTEINSQNFTVQRSSDGGKTWITVGIQPTQAANGNSSVPLTYQLTDPSVPIGNYLYRVMETDINGATTASNTVEVTITGTMMVYPNPAKSILNVKLPAGANNVPYRLISADGKIVLSGTLANLGGHGQIPVIEIASAVYFLQITVNNTVQTYEVRIQH